ncbi:hypothetical protein GCM10022416_17960 [Actinomadura keratinilytica]|uniref:Uncharacterized protein n=1 Tax=Actinomadura keratinilytica TaxID=547461 RepID=A0ABP7YHK3_9ACTN
MGGRGAEGVPRAVLRILGERGGCGGRPVWVAERRGGIGGIGRRVPRRGVRVGRWNRREVWSMAVAAVVAARDSEADHISRVAG